MSGGAVVTTAENLPSLIDRAASVLAGARTAAEILDARQMANVVYDAAKLAARFAKAKGAHDDLIAAAYRMQADALEIEAGAKRRLADEYDAAQERGEVGQEGRPKTVPDGNGIAPASAGDLGLSRKDIHEARQVRDAEASDPGIVRRTLDDKLSRGEEPTKAALKAAVRAQREAERVEHDRQREEHRAKLPENIQRAEAAKESNREKRRTSLNPIAQSDRIAELEEAVAVLTTEAEALRAENKLYGDMRVQWEQGGYDKVIAGLNEALRVAKERTYSEHQAMQEWKGQAAYWKGQSIKLGWKSGDKIIDIKTGEMRDA